MVFVSIVIPVPPNTNTEKIAKRLDIDYPDLEILVAVGKQPARERNLAVKEAKGEVIFFFDDDTIPPSDIVHKALNHFEDKSVVGVGGPNLAPTEETFFGRLSDVVLSTRFAMGLTRSRFMPLGNIRDATENDLILCNFAIRRKIFEEMDGFNEELFPNEENELYNRILSKGYRLVYDPEMIVYRSRDESLLSFCRRFFKYGRGRGEQSVIQPSSITLLHPVPSLFNLYLISLPFAHTTVYTLPLLVYTFLAFFSTLLKVAEKRDPKVFSILFLLPLVHICYGLGFPFGIIKKLFIKKKPEGEIIVRKYVND